MPLEITPKNKAAKKKAVKKKPTRLPPKTALTTTIKTSINQSSAKDPSHPSAAKNVGEAKLAVMAEVAYVRKTTTEGLPYPFASEAGFIAVLRPSLVRHQIDIFPSNVEIIESGDYKTSRGTMMRLVRIRIEYTMTHAPSGTWQKIMVFGEAADSSDKCLAKAMTIGLKYALRQSFVIETGDDPDAVKEPLYPISGHSGVSSREALLAAKDNHPLFKTAVDWIRKAASHEDLARHELRYKSKDRGFDAEQIAELDREREDRAAFLGPPKG